MSAQTRPSEGTRIFISYRREDSAGYVRAVFESLEKHFGGEIFMDVESLRRPGTDFVQAIENAVSRCDALVVLIGPRWLTVTDADGRRRLDQPDDWVRIEIAAGLSRGVLVIPALVQGARMPRHEDLPSDLVTLARLQALEVSDTRWDYDVGVLTSALAEKLGVRTPEATPKPVAPTPTGPSRWRKFAIFGAVGLGLWLLAASSSLFAPSADPSGYTTNDATPVPSIPSSPAPPTLRLVTLRPDQVIMPLDQFPLVRHHVSVDQVLSADAWVREFVPDGGQGASYYWVRVIVEVAPSVAVAQSTLATNSQCAYPGPSRALTTTQLAAPGNDIACRWDFDTSSIYMYTRQSRNVAIATVSNPIGYMTDQDALSFLATLASQQQQIIDRLVPQR